MCWWELLSVVTHMPSMQWYFEMKGEIGDGPEKECPESGIDDIFSYKRKPVICGIPC